MAEQNVASYSTPYKYTGQELDDDTDYYYYGARYYDPRVSQFMGVDPLADAPLNVGTSPYAYVWNNPLKFIDPDGRHGTNTIYFDQDGNEIGRTEDNLSNAIVIVDDLSAFNEIMNGNLTGDEKAAALRSTGSQTYHTDGMESLFNTAASDPADNQSMYWDGDGNPVTDLKSEWASFLVNTNCEIKVSDCQFSDHSALNVFEDNFNFHSDVENIVGTIHTHTNTPGRKISYSGGTATFHNGPTPRDKNFMKFRSANYFEAVIDVNNIYLHRKGMDKPIVAPRSFFKK